MVYINIILLWTFFGILHSLLISPGVLSFLSVRLGRYFAFYRLGYNLLALLTFIPPYLYTKMASTPQAYTFAGWRWLQGFFLILGLGLVAAAFRTYDWREFIGLKQAESFWRQGQVQAPRHSRIVREGLLAVVRHPIYLGTLIFLWSLDATWAELVAKLVMTGYILVGIRLEERKLVAEFGEEYRRYQREVPMLFPGIKRLWSK